MNYLKAITYTVLVLAVFACISGKTNTTEDINIVEKESSNPVYLTCYGDSRLLLFFVPVTLEISHSFPDTLKLDDASISDCNSQKMKMMFYKSLQKIDAIDPDNLENKIAPGKSKSITLYKGYSLDENDSTYRAFKKEISIIKMSSSSKNNYANDTIVYSGKRSFMKQHSTYYNNKIKPRCQEIKLYFHSYNKTRNELQTPLRIITLNNK